MVKKAIKLIALSEFFVLLSYFISFGFYMNLQIAYLSSLFIILGASFAYKKMINTQVEADIIKEERDFLDELEDPHGLYDDESINEAPPEELDLKTIVQEEKKKIKIVNFKDMKNGSKAGFSLFRLIPYLFLVLGFIALKNNELLNISVYLPSLLVGIVVGYLSSKEIFA
ncbi:MAG: hypothetical protein Q7S59_08950 [Sulfurimonas sp.]|nr:hypothetical protein [Sulfurimonas sp.]